MLNASYLNIFRVAAPPPARARVVRGVLRGQLSALRGQHPRDQPRGHRPPLPGAVQGGGYNEMSRNLVDIFNNTQRGHD